MELRALGPLELWQGEQRRDLGSVKERCVLAVLVHARGRSVTAEALTDRVWDGAPPPSAQGTLHSLLSRLRSKLKPYRDAIELERPSPGVYRLRVRPGSVDLLRFEELRAQTATAVAQGERRMAVGLLRAAESLWRGEPLAEFPGTWASATRARLLEDLRRVREQRIRLELEAGGHSDLIGELQELVAENPLAQRLVASLMLALYRCGRHAEALDLYRTTHRRLDEEQGMAPAAELRDLHRRILEQDRELLAAPTPAAGTPVDAAVTPAPRTNLPRDTHDFTGRTSELSLLLTDTATRAAEGGREKRALPLTLIQGMPGVGKTSLAVHVAYGLSRAYPDGQLFLDLRGFSGQPPCDPAEALAILLQTCGAPKLPDTLDERASAWREWTARRRLLLVLDNARDAAQVEPLLPASPDCRAIVTSRNRLRLDGAGELHLDVLPAAEAAELFTRVVGAARLPGDGATLAGVVAACGCNPLAVQLLAGRFRHRGSWDLPHLLDRLSQAGDPLDELDPAVAAAFRLSYEELSPPAREMLCALALAPGPDLPPTAILALVGAAPDMPPAGPRRSIDELQDCNLLDEPVRDRYRLHDLTRLFGLQAGRHALQPAARQAAFDRLAAHYLTAAHRATRLAHPRHRILPLPPGLVSPYAPRFADADVASVWLSVERANLLATAAHAATASPATAALFPHVLAPSLERWGAREPAAALYDAALAVLRTRGDTATLARTLVDRAAQLAKENPEEALRNAREALAEFRRGEDESGCADALLQVARAHVTAGDSEATLRVLNEALSLYAKDGNRHGEAQCLNVRGLALRYAGRHREAVETAHATLALRRKIGDLYGEAMALNNIGELRRGEGDYAAARACYEQSLALMRRCGERGDLAILSTNLGIVHHATGHTSEALASFHQALQSHRAAGDALGEVHALTSLGNLYAECGRRSEAVLHFGMAARLAATIGNAYERQRALIGMADVHRLSGKLTAARETYELGHRIADEAGIPLGSAHALEGLARVALAAGDEGEMRRCAELAVGLYRAREAHPDAARVARLLREHGMTGS
ncbi:AfsR/SARP family transcriptional regulator [Streptomyces sp. CMB-StM0423]|uniref:AfsR/SARP family transcriptional regulator n=1 Tax=Streptomyces sp. CMB-StM0423 TaxID=2059884 RepID=UPI001F1F832E|nr:BTAD domain-containing putative transcriptional regulator [Streptomyces sp. CMB-StM0423]